MTTMDSLPKKRPAAQFNIAQAKAHFSELVQRAMNGEEVVIAKDNTPVVKLVALRAPGRTRKPGSAKGKIWMAPDFDAELEDFRDYT